MHLHFPRNLAFTHRLQLFLLNAAFIGSTISGSLIFGNVLVMGYHWETRNVGLLQVPLAVGSVLSIPLVGFGSDWVIKKLAKRNNGIHEVSQDQSKPFSVIFPWRTDC